MTSEEKAARTKGVIIGMVIAAGMIAKEDDVLAEEILGNAGVTTAAKAKAAGVDQYDIDMLKEVFGYIADRKKSAA